MSLATLETAQRIHPDMTPVAGPTFSARRLHAARLDRNLDFERLATLVGRHARTVRRYESGQIVPPADAIGALSVALGVPVGDLFE